MNFNPNTETQIESVIQSIINQVEDARKHGPESMHCVLVSNAYTLGTMIPQCVKEEAYGYMTMQMIEALGNGLQTGMQMVGAKGSMTMVTRERVPREER